MRSESESDDYGTAIHREEATKQKHGSTVKITVEVFDDGQIDEEKARDVAISALEGGVGTEYVSWDDQFRVPTVGNRVI